VTFNDSLQGGLEMAERGERLSLGVAARLSR